MPVGLAGPGAEPVDLRKLSDKELIERYCSEPHDQEAFAELWKRHEQRIQRCVGHFRIMCPHFHSQDIFCEEVFSRTQGKVAQKVCGYEGRATFSTWLYTIIERQAIEERRKIMGRDETKPRVFVDLTEAELVKTYAVFRDKVRQDPLRSLAVEERKAILKKVLGRYVKSPEGYDSLRAVQLDAIDECTVAEIARRFFTYHRKIGEMLGHDYLTLKTSLAEAGIRNLQDLIPSGE